MAIVKGNNNKLWKAVWGFLKKLKTELLYYPVILFLGIYPKEHKTGYSRDTCTLMFMAALFTIAKPWKQPKCSTTGEWYTYTMDYYSATRNNDMWFESIWIHLEDSM
jgi:hypothetical protein